MNSYCKRTWSEPTVYGSRFLTSSYILENFPANIQFLPSFVALIPPILPTPSNTIVDYQFEQSRQVGYVTTFGIPLSLFLCGSQLGSRVSGDFKILFPFIEMSPQHSKYKVPFECGKLNWLRIRILPTGPHAKRPGMWALGFMPFRVDTDERLFLGDAAYNKKGKIIWYSRNPTFNGLMKWPGAVSGTADQPLEIVFEPKVTDGLIFNYQLLGTVVGGVALSFVGMEKMSYARGDVAFSCEIDGEVTYRSRPSSVKNTNIQLEYSDDVVRYSEQGGSDCHVSFSMCYLKGMGFETLTDLPFSVTLRGAKITTLKTLIKIKGKGVKPPSIPWIPVKGNKCDSDEEKDQTKEVCDDLKEWTLLGE